MAKTDGNRDQRTYRAQDVRQGRIILTTRARRWIFIGGLVAAILLVALIGTFG